MLDMQSHRLLAPLVGVDGIVLDQHAIHARECGAEID